MEVALDSRSREACSGLPRRDEGGCGELQAETDARIEPRAQHDLVAGRGALVAFVEVKTRASRGAGPPAEAVDARKRARLVRGAAAWLAAHGRPGLHARFDVIACERGPDGAWRLEHLEGAFDAGDS